jgi:transposase
VDPERLFFFDEFGFNLGMTRRYARAPSGERAHYKVPSNVGVSITLVLGLGLRGAVAPCAFKGAIDGHVFGTYLIEQAIPHLPSDAIIVIDNLPAHHAEEAIDALEERGVAVVEDLGAHVGRTLKGRGVQLWFLPPYSPQMSPVEECGSKIKALTRAKDPRTESALIDAMGDAIGKVTPQDARGWFAHARRDRAPLPRSESANHRSQGPSNNNPYRVGTNG